MSEAARSSANAAQIEYWNTAAGETWAQFQEQLDRLVGPLGLEALRVLAPANGDSVLDIGCGCGQTCVLARYATQQGVLMPAAVWIVLAHNKS